MKYSPQQLRLQLFKPPYRYAIDACSIIAQNPVPHAYPREVHESLWSRIDDLVRRKEIVTCGQVAREVVGEDLAAKWIVDSGIEVIEEDEDIQEMVRVIVNEHPDLLNFNKVKSSGDAFLIATAKVYSLTIITEENKASHNKIPAIASLYGLQSVNISELCEREGWKF